jgi:hypothetical protein
MKKMFRNKSQYPIPEATPENAEVNLLRDVMKKLEMEGMVKVQQLNQSTICDSPEQMIEALNQIIHDGEEEFIDKIGRPMTNLEKRKVYG